MPLTGIPNVDAAITERLLQTGEEIAAVASAFCPVDTGRLKASIHTDRSEPGTVYIGSDVEYAAYVEFGTVHFGKHNVPGVELTEGQRVTVEGRSYATMWIISPQPYLRPARYTAEPIVRQIWSH